MSRFLHSKKIAYRHRINRHGGGRMLSANSETGEQMRLTLEVTKERLKEIRKECEFYCPACGQKVMLKIGEIIIPHFAHVRKNDCDVFSEGETAIHLKGKHLLYSWLQSQKIPTLLEPYLKRIRQRPDLLVKNNEKYYAIEFQCSPITKRLLDKRNQGYQAVDVTPIWFPKTVGQVFSGARKVRLTPFTQQFIKSASCISFDVENRCFWHFNHLVHISGNQFIATVKNISLKEQQFQSLSLKEEINHELYDEIWQIEKIRYLQNRVRFNKRGLKDPFLKESYDEKIMLGLIPNWIGIPMSEVQSKHSVEWQLLAVLLMKSIGRTDVYHYFHSKYPQYRITKKEFQYYVDFLCEHNPKLEWEDLEGSIFSSLVYNYFEL